MLETALSLPAAHWMAASGRKDPQEDGSSRCRSLDHGEWRGSKRRPDPCLKVWRPSGWMPQVPVKSTGKSRTLFRIELGIRHFWSSFWWVIQKLKTAHRLQKLLYFDMDHDFLLSSYPVLVRHAFLVHFNPVRFGFSFRIRIALNRAG